MIDLLSMDQQNMVDFLSEAGFSSFRGKQVYQWCHVKEVFDFEQMTNLPRNLREYLRANVSLCRGELLAQQKSDDGKTVKFLLSFHGDLIETVLMCYDRMKARDRHTLCVSTQVGCGMGCRFCATGQSGLKRNLTCGEIVDQVNFVNQYLRERGEEPVSNIVYMGMGEPLQNYDALLKSVRILNHAKKIGMRRVTISTCGLIHEIDRLASEKLQLTLAVSLHGANQNLRASLMPIARQNPLNDLMRSLEHYIALTGRRVTLEYAMFQKINDSLKDADDLIRLIDGGCFHVNLVPGNLVEGTNLFRSDEKRIRAFMNKLESNGISVTIRESKGKDIEGACGQLRARYKK